MFMCAMCVMYMFMHFIPMDLSSALFMAACANYGNLHIDLIFKLLEKIARIFHVLLGKQAIVN